MPITLKDEYTLYINASEIQCIAVHKKKRNGYFIMNGGACIEVSYDSCMRMLPIWEKESGRKIKDIEDDDGPSIKDRLTLTEKARRIRDGKGKKD